MRSLGKFVATAAAAAVALLALIVLVPVGYGPGDRIIVDCAEDRFDGPGWTVVEQYDGVVPLYHSRHDDFGYTSFTAEEIVGFEP